MFVLANSVGNTRCLLNKFDNDQHHDFTMRNGTQSLMTLNEANDAQTELGASHACASRHALPMFGFEIARPFLVFGFTDSVRISAPWAKVQNYVPPCQNEDHIRYFRKIWGVHVKIAQLCIYMLCPDFCTRVGKYGVPYRHVKMKVVFELSGLSETAAPVLKSM